MTPMKHQRGRATSYLGVPGSDPAGGELHSEPKCHSIVQSHPYSSSCSSATYTPENFKKQLRTFLCSDFVENAKLENCCCILINGCKYCTTDTTAGVNIHQMEETLLIGWR